MYLFFFFKQKTAYEMRISDWSSDVCSSDLLKIQREALKKEKDAESRQRLADLESAIEALEREYNDLEEVWKTEKATLQGATKVKEQIEAAKDRKSGV